MQNPKGTGIANQADDRNNAYQSVVSDLVSLIEHVQASRQLIEQAIAREASIGSPDGDIIELDDVTPSFVRATVALNVCDTNLAIALRSLLDSEASDYLGHLARICA